MKNVFFDYEIDREEIPISVPDIVIEKKTKDDFECRISDSYQIDLSFNEQLYRESIQKIRKEKDKEYIKEKSDAAKLLIKSINARSFTLLKVMNEIAYRQFDFLNGNTEYANSLEIKDVAISLMLHESTVRRAIQGKTVQTLRGITEIKSLFPKKTKSTADIYRLETDYEIKEYISRLINDEPKDSLYSDSDIMCLLNSRGIEISRRTVTKYRNNLNIPNTSQRNKIYGTSNQK